MKILDKNHYYKIDGELILYIEELCIAVKEEDIFKILLLTGKIYEKVNATNAIMLEEVK